MTSSIACVSCPAGGENRHRARLGQEVSITSCYKKRDIFYRPAHLLWTYADPARMMIDADARDA
jgi:hypothetical protein